MSENRKLPEKDIQNVTFECKTEKEITSKDIDDFETFNKGVIARMKKLRQDNPLFESEITGSFVHIYAKTVIQDTIRENKSIEVVFAKDGPSLVGYSIVGVDREQKSGDFSYIGVSKDTQGQGIGKKLLELRHERLRDIDIKSYTTNARSEILAWYDKLGITYRRIDKENATPSTISVGTKVEVFT